MDHARQKSLADVDEHARIATSGAAEAIIETAALRRRIESLETWRDEQEDNQRPSRIDSDFEERVLAAIDKRRTDRPDIEFANPKGIRVRGSGWSVAVVSVALLLFALIWQGPGLLAALRK